MSRKMKLDFTGVESFQRAAEGSHLCKIVSADEKTSQGGNEMIVVAFEVIKGESKSARVYENYPLIDTALWKLKGMLQAIGMKADGKVALDLDKLIGKTCIVTVKHEEYEGKTRARVDEVSKVPVADSDDDDEDDEVEDTDEDEDEVMPAPTKDKKPEKKAPEKAKATKKAAEEDEDDDDDWDDEDEEEEKPTPKKSKKPEAKEEAKPEKKPAKKSKAAKEDDDDDDDWDDDDWDE